MKIIIPSKSSNSGSVHDIASDTHDREINIPKNATHVIILAAYYGGRGYTTHITAEAAAKRCKSLSRDGYSYQVFTANGACLSFDGADFRRDDPNMDLGMEDNASSRLIAGAERVRRGVKVPLSKDEIRAGIIEGQK